LEVKKMKRELSGQNVVIIRNAEDPDDYANWGGTGYYVPPIGTMIATTFIKTEDNSVTAADNTPDAPSSEVIEGNTTLSLPKDEDDKEASDFTGREIKRDPGNEMNDVTLEYNEERGKERLGTSARKYHPTNRNYEGGIEYVRYEVMLISHPRDSSSNALPVKPGLDKTLIGEAEKVIYFRDVTLKSKSPTLESGEKARSSLTGNAEIRKIYMNYIFGADLKVSGTISGATPITMDSQPKIPTRIKFDVTAETAPGDIVFAGTNQRGEAITETITTSGVGAYYTKKVFSTITNGTPDGTLNCTASVEADELY
jgi:hypothetical protein